MKSVIKRFFQREKTYIFSVFVMVVCITIATPVVLAIVNHFTTTYYEDEAHAISYQLQSEEQDALTAAETVGNEQSVQGWIKNNDALSLLSYTTDTKDLLHLDNMVITDSQGFVISRAQNATVRSDNVFFATEQGREVAQGKPIATIEAGTANPLVMLGAAAIKENGVISGAVFASRYLNDSFATLFKAATGINAEIVFYSKDKGIVGSSVTDPAIKTVLSQYINSGSEWIQNGKTDARFTIPFKATYFVSNVIFPGLVQSPGGMLILFSQTKPNVLTDMIVEIVNFLIFALLFFAIRHAFRKRFKEHRHNLYRHFSVASVVLLLYTFGFLFYITSGSLVIVTPSSSTIYNSTMSLSPNNQIVLLSNEQMVNIVVSSGGEPVNAFNVELDYDPSMISIAGISLQNSICPQDTFLANSNDPVAGKVTITCIIPTPGFAAQGGVIAQLLITHKKAGTFALAFGTSTQVLANDGLGTDVLRYTENGSYQVVDSDSQTALIYSPSNPDSEKWYNNRKVSFSLLPCASCTYQYLVNASSTDAVGAYSTTTSNSFNTSVPEDGIYYLHVIETVPGSSDMDQVAGTLKFMVDATPPLPIINADTLTPKVGQVVRFAFTGSDATSGLQKNYYVSIDGSEFLPLGNSLFTSFPKAGEHTIIARLYDNAGNHSDSTVVIDVQ